MRLYLTESGFWFGTQADARGAALEESRNPRGWTAVDVPTDKAGLIGFLNQQRSVDVAPPIVSLQSAGDHPGGGDTIAIEEAIGASDLPNAIRLASHALSRVQEHVNALGRRA